MKKLEEEKMMYTQMPGVTENGDKPWDDCDEFTKNDIFKSKILNIKLYYENDYIIGISFTYKNLITRKIKVIEHLGKEIDNEKTKIKELNLDENEYISKFYANYNDKIENFLTIGFGTNKNRQILVGEGCDSDVYFNSQDDKNIIIGSFGFLQKKIKAIGCLYYKKSIILKYDLFKFLELRNKIKKNEEFKNKMDKDIGNLDIIYKYIWKTVNLPNTPFAVVLGFCCY